MAHSHHHHEQEHHHGDTCGHRHGHHHEAHPSHQHAGKLKWAMGLTVVYLVAEVVGGLYSDSLALLADAGHMLADAGAIGLAWFAAWICAKPAGSQQTYGFYRAEILAAFVNGLLLAGISLWILIEAWQRFATPEPVDGPVMLWVALGGFFINLWVMRILHGDHDHNMNMKGAYLHVLGDLLGSVGTLVAAGCILWLGWQWADPAISIVIALLVLISAVRLVIEATDVLMETCPRHIDVEQVRTTLLGQPGVEAIHDLHVWAIASGKVALSVHVVVAESAFHPGTLSHLQQCLNDRFGIGHATLQLEPPGFEEADIHF